MYMDYKKLLDKADAARDEAEAAREVMSNVIERVNDGFVALDSDWRYTYVNARAARMLQRENPEDLIGKHIWTEYPEGVGQPFHQAYLKAFETQQPVIFEEHYAPWNQWFENRIYPSSEGITIYFTDITERKQAELLLNRVNRALMVLSGCNEALIRATSETELLDKVCSIIAGEGQYPLVWLGYAESDENKSIHAVAHRGFTPGDLDEISISWGDNELGLGPMGVAIRTGQPAVARDILSNSDCQWWQDTAQKYDLSATIALPISASGHVYGALNIFARMPDAFDEEEMRLLQELADDLGFGIAILRARNEQKQLQRQLQQAQKMEAMGQLTGGIAHDFNNILASIMGYTGLALERYAGTSEPKLAEYLNEVYRAGERGQNLIAQMLAFSRRTENNAKAVAPEPLVKEVIKLLQSTLPSSIRLHTETDPDVPNIMMDPVHLHQLLMNLCINARDALEGEGLIKVLIRQVSHINTECCSCHEPIKGDFVELVVSDSGKGIEPTAMDNIFDPFFTTKETGKGTGMGLSMVHGIVHEHGGHILVETSQGNGSTFRLLFPAVSGEDQISDIEEFSYSGMLQGINEGHLLVVDDDESMAMLVTELLSLCGYQVTMMTDSTEALSLFKQNPQRFALVITDQTMPGITGIELAKKMLLLRQDIPIILCTGYSEKVDEETAKTFGIQQFLKKPFKTKVLLESVSKLLGINEHK